MYFSGNNGRILKFSYVFTEKDSKYLRPNMESVRNYSYNSAFYCDMFT